MISEFLVPLDGLGESTRALDLAAAFARRLHVPVSTAIVSSPNLDAMADVQWMEDVATNANVELRRSVVLPDNDVVGALLAFAAEEDGSLLCMASHGRGAVGQAVLGSVSAEVMRKSTRPVMLVGPWCSTKASFDTVHICLDGSMAAIRAIEPGVEWARAFGATPWLVHVEDPGSPAVFGDTTVGVEVEGPADELIARGVQAQWEVLHGTDPAIAIVEHAESMGAGLIVVTTHGRSGLRAVVLGSVATEIVRNATCPVLLLGPQVEQQRLAA